MCVTFFSHKVTIYYIFTGVNISLFSMSPFNSEHFQQQIFILHRTLSEEFINSEIIATQIALDTEDSENVT